jgi:hypothetical protein
VGIEGIHIAATCVEHLLIFKIPMVIGAVLEVFAIFMVSLCKEYYQFFLGKVEIRPCLSDAVC